jgi:hypothetical protein
MTVVRIAGELLAAVIAAREGGSLLIGCRRRVNTPHLLIGFSRAPTGEPGRASAEPLAAVLGAELGPEVIAVRATAGTVIWSLDLKSAAERATRVRSVEAA